MLLYIVRRTVWATVVVLIVLLLTYAVFYLLPAGDPALRFAGKSPTPESLALIRHRLGLDQPWYEQYGRFVKNFFAGDEFGWPGLGLLVRQPGVGARARWRSGRRGRCF